MVRPERSENNTMRSYDMLVIGSGPAGQKAAIQAAKLGKRVAIIEQATHLGGTSVNTGTLPSKTLKDTIDYLQGFARRGFPHWSAELASRITLPDLMARKDQVIKAEIAVITDQLQRNGVDVIQGTASFVDPRTLSVAQLDGRTQQARASVIVLATGSRPHRPAAIPFDDLTIFDSDSILTTRRHPRSILVVGGGVIGVEYASMFAVFGIQVTLIDRRSQLLRFMNQEVVQVLQTQMQQAGVVMRLHEECQSIAPTPRGQAIVRLCNGETVTADMVLYAMGRLGNTASLQLERIGLRTDKQGQLQVNARYQTAIPHIYAVGDVIGFPALAATAMEQGRLATCHAFQVPQPPEPKLIPFGIYSIPEVSMVGKTEEELTAAGIPYEVGRAFYREVARGHISGDLLGFLKLVFHRKSRTLLGVHILGPGATELIHIGQSVLTYEGSVEYFVHNVFNYPTMAECYRIAALDGLNGLETRHRSHAA
jgi:NAD(P) transhydrogenase